MRRRHRPIVSTLACCVMVLAACGGDAQDAPRAEPDPASAPAASSAAAATTAAPAATGAGSSATTATATAPPTAPATTAPAAAAAAPEALQFTASLVGGGEIDLAGYGGQPVLFWFWAPY